MKWNKIARDAYSSDAGTVRKASWSTRWNWDAGPHEGLSVEGWANTRSEAQRACERAHADILADQVRGQA